MNFRTVTTQVFVAASFLFSFGLASCTSSSTPSKETFRLGQFPFQLDVKTVESLEIARANPKTGEAWTARFRRAQDGQWEIASAPGGINPLDRKAHSTLIDHLLDSLKTLKIKALAPKGPLESFDLAPPRLALRWDRTEFSLGSGTFAALNGTVYEMEGAALKILEYAESFQSLRQQTWLYPLASDDVDEVEIFFPAVAGMKARSFYAQREGTIWTDRRHKPVSQDVPKFLDQMTHLRIQEFIDDEQVSSEIQEKLRKAPFRKVVFKDRHGNATEIRLGKPDPLFGMNSARSASSFRIHPGAMRFFEVFQK